MRSKVNQQTNSSQVKSENDFTNTRKESVLGKEESKKTRNGLLNGRGQNAANSGEENPNPRYSGVQNFAHISILSSHRFRLQPKLKINPSNDNYEQEADRVAEQVMRMPEQKLQHKYEKCRKEEEIQSTPGVKIQRKCAKCEEEEMIQTKSKGNSPNMASAALMNQIQHTRGGGQVMDANTRSFMEPRFGMDFSGVRIHADNQAAGMNREINAKAFTVGSDIYFNRGAYNPEGAKGKKLLAHELTHTMQQGVFGFGSSPTASMDIQRKGGSVGGFFRNIGRGIASVFGNELEFSDEEIQAYLAVLDVGDIEDDYISDDKARAVVKKWKTGTLELSHLRKVLLIREMFSGFTGDADEQAILDILKGSAGELTYILTKIKPVELRSEFQGAEFQELESILKPWEERTGNVKSEPLTETTAEKQDQTKIMGDSAVVKAWKNFLTLLLSRFGLGGVAVNEGMTLQEFDQYIHRQADWFAEEELKNNEAIRNQLWEIAFLLGEGNHISTALGKLKLNKVINATADEMKALRAYAEGANSAAKTVRITQPHADFNKIVEWGNAMLELKTFVPDLVLKVVIDQDFLNDLITPINFLAEFKKYYQDFTPTIERKQEKTRIIVLLAGGLTRYKNLKNWIHDLHVLDVETRLKLVNNVKDTKRKRPVLLFLISGLDYNSAFLYWTNLKSAILDTRNLALVLQGQESLSALTIRVKDVARDYGQINRADGKAKLGQVVIAGHGSPKSIEQATTGKLSAKQDPKHVKYEEEDLQVGKAGSDSEKLVDALLEVLDPKDARIVFAGCSVGAHSIPLNTQLQTDSATAAKTIRDAIKQNPNLRDLVVQRAKALKVKNKVQVEAAIATTTASAFQLDKSGKAILYLKDDPEVGKTVKDYVQRGSEPSGALKAALETWADKKLGPAWTTKAMRAYVTTYSAVTGWWKSITRTAYEFALPPIGNVHPTALNYLSRWAQTWFLMGFASLANAENLANAVANSEKKLKKLPHDANNFPVAAKLYPVMLASDWKNDPHLKVVIYQAWMQVDASKAADFLTALGTTSLKGNELYLFFKMGLMEKHLPALLKPVDPKNPSPSQLKLALIITENMKSSMPETVKTFLKNAAGNATSTTFPASLKVADYLEGTTEFNILDYIGLAPGTVVSSPSTKTKSTTSSSGTNSKDANADLDADNTKNESFISVQPRKLTLPSDAPVWEKPDPASKVLTTLKKGAIVRVAGSTIGWAVIDFNGKVAYIDMTLIS